MQKLKCTRCHYEWLPRKETPPAACPSCKSRYWDREKRSVVSKKDKDLG